MLKLDNYSHSYSSDDILNLKNIDFEIKKGDLILITGDTGGGKTTLIYALNGIIPHVLGGRSSGSQKLYGKELSLIPLTDISRSISTLFQSPDAQIFMPTVREEILLTCSRFCSSPDEANKKTDAVIKKLRLNGLENKKISELSGGQKKLTVMAEVYAGSSDIILFDEPFSGLDKRGKLDFLNIVKELKEGGKAVVIVEHRYEELLGIADKVFKIQDGKLERFKEESHIQKPPVIARGKSSKKREAIVKARNLSFAYGDGESVLKDVNLEIKKGEILALIGFNGVGKTTLLKVLSGILKPVEGEFSVCGMNNPSLDKLIGRLAFVFQNPDLQLFAETVYDEINFASKIRGGGFETNDIIEAFGLKPFLRRHPHSLSKGERKLIAIAASIALKPEIIFLDEPSAGFDGKTLDFVFQALLNLVSEDTTVVFSTHDNRVLNYAERTVKMERGGVIKNEFSRL